MLPGFREEGFEYRDDAGKEKMTKQYLELILVTLAQIDLILDESIQLQLRYRDYFFQLKDEVLREQSRDKFLKKVLYMDSEQYSDSFYNCLRERINLYKYEIKSLLQTGDFPHAIYYYYYENPGNILSTDGYYEIIDETDDSNDIPIWTHTIKEMNSFLKSQLSG